MSFAPDHTDIRILLVLSEKSGMPTGAVSDKLVPRSMKNRNRRARSQVTRCRLLALQSAGLVGILDSEKPVMWTRTAAGTVALPSDLR